VGKVRNYGEPRRGDTDDADRFHKRDNKFSAFSPVVVRCFPDVPVGHVPPASLISVPQRYRRQGLGFDFYPNFPLRPLAARGRSPYF
jgi:hypothetical protein